MKESTLKSTPFPVNWRELWLPEHINDVNWPSAIPGGHPMTLVNGAAKKTTADGVRFYYNNANAYINCGAIHNAEAKLWLSFRFKLSQNYVAGGNDWVLWFKGINVADRMFIFLRGASGGLRFQKDAGGANAFNLNSAETSWAAGVWYHVLASISSVNGARLRINNGAAATSIDVSAVPNGGNFVIGAYGAGGANDANCIISDFFVGTDDLTATEEADLYKGVPPADTVHAWALDEGRGLTAYDRGSAPANGTLGSACTWAFGRVKQPVMSPDGIDGTATAANLKINDSITMVWLGKIKANYSSLAAVHWIYRYRIDATNHISFYYSSGGNTMYTRIQANGIDKSRGQTPFWSIDDYLIVIFSIDAAKNIAAPFYNGSAVATLTGTGNVPADNADLYLNSSVGVEPDICKTVLIGVTEGALTEKQAKDLSRFYNEKFNLGLAI